MVIERYPGVPEDNNCIIYLDISFSFLFFSFLFPLSVFYWLYFWRACVFFIFIFIFYFLSIFSFFMSLFGAQGYGWFFAVCLLLAREKGESGVCSYCLGNGGHDVSLGSVGFFFCCVAVSASLESAASGS
jgi:hypothetical protein